MIINRLIPTVLFTALVLCGLVACKDVPAGKAKVPAGEASAPPIVHQIGSIAIYESDVEFLLGKWDLAAADDSARDRAIQELVRRARLSQAALDAEIDREPTVRAEIARILAARHRDKVLEEEIGVRVKHITEDRLRELYSEQPVRFRSKEKRRVAVLWLNPGKDPAREQTYRGRLVEAREWLFKNRSLVDDPTQGFSALSVDFSEHRATRFKGGELGWMEEDGYSDSWRQAVAKIAFTLDRAGEVSSVVSGAEGVFLVRLIEIQPGIDRPFEAVRGQLEREERRRVKSAVESEFEERIERSYPVASGIVQGGARH